MIGNLLCELRPPPADVDKALAGLRTDPFDSAARKLALVGHVKQPVLKTR
jgi:hypothetical protein